MIIKSPDISCIAPLHTKHPCFIPFAESLISAGFPSSAENFTEHALDLNDLLIAHPAATFFVRVTGDSMIEAGINSGDMLIVDRSLAPAHNKIAIVRINDEFTLKRLHYHATGLLLMAANPHYKPITITSETDFEIWGIVTFIIHKPK